MQVFAHRGHFAEYPENTVGAFRAAARLGAHGIELDVHLTHDGHPVVLHDAHVDRTTDSVGSVAELTLKELQQLDTGSGECVPTLGEIFQALGESLRINVHLKAIDDNRLVPAVLTEITQHAMLNHAYLATNEPTWQQARSLEPKLSGCHLGPHPRNTPAFLEKTHTLDCSIIQLDWRIIDALFVDMAHDLGIEVHAMHLVANYDEHAFDSIPPTGVDAVLTDYPKRWLAGQG
ncbi:MAG: glycerophosphodiester phosphodiesterase family protein [Candidatus Latescibacterota bacterium]|nr:glycerophosphodiester phosphodiesterase family protein [Candidatus Latescibacterota bacterium]